MDLRRVALVCMVLAAAAAPAYAFYEDDDNVTMLTPENFKSEVIESDGFTFVEFFAPWCGHCKQLTPEWKAMAAKLKGLVKVAAVDCTGESKPICDEYGVRGFPTMKMFTDVREYNPYKNQEPMKKPIDFQSARDARGMGTFALRQLHDREITRLTSENRAQFVQKHGDQDRLLLFTDKDKVSNLYKALSLEFKGRVAFAQVQDSETDILEAYGGADEFPKLVYVSAKTQEHHVYQGSQFKHDPIVEWLNEYAPAWTAPKPPPLPDFFVKISKRNINRVLSSRYSWVLYFHNSKPGACKECEKMRSDVNKMALDVKGYVRVGAVDAAEGKGRAVAKMFGVDKFPTVLRLPVEGKKAQKSKLNAVFKDKKKTLAKLTKFATAAVDGSNVVELEHNNMADMFLSSDSEMSKAILVTDRADVPPLYKGLAAEFKDRLKFGLIRKDNTQLLERFQIKPDMKMPILLVLFLDAEGKKEFKKGRQAGMKAAQYQGMYKFFPVANWLTQFADEAVEGEEPEPEISDEDADLVPQVNSADDFEKHCRSKPGICIVAMFGEDDFVSAKELDEDADENDDGSSSSSGDDDAKVPRFLPQLEDAAGAYQNNKNIHFVWMDGRQQTEFADKVGILNAGFPGMVALHPKKLAKANFFGTMSEEAKIREFVKGVLSGQVRVSRIDALPKVVDGSATAAKEEL